MGVRRGAKRAFSPLEIETKNENFLEKLKLAAQFRSVYLILEMAVYVPVWHSHCTQARFIVLVLCTVMMLWCYAVMSLQVTPVRSYACRGRWSNLRAVCSTVGLYCVTTTWQQIFIGSLQVTVESVLPHVTVEKHTFWQVYCSERVTADSGSNAFLYCVKSTN